MPERRGVDRPPLGNSVDAAGVVARSERSDFSFNSTGEGCPGAVGEPGGLGALKVNEGGLLGSETFLVGEGGTTDRVGVAGGLHALRGLLLGEKALEDGFAAVEYAVRGAHGVDGRGEG